MTVFPPLGRTLRPQGAESQKHEIFGVTVTVEKFLSSQPPITTYQKSNITCLPPLISARNWNSNVPNEIGRSWRRENARRGCPESWLRLRQRRRGRLA